MYRSLMWLYIPQFFDHLFHIKHFWLIYVFLLDLSQGLFLYKQHNKCHMWSRICLPFMSTRILVLVGVCVAQFSILCVVYYCLSFNHFSFIVLALTILFQLVSLSIPLVSLTFFCTISVIFSITVFPMHLYISMF